jgi:hypothetical protein
MQNPSLESRFIFWDKFVSKDWKLQCPSHSYNASKPLLSHPSLCSGIARPILGYHLPLLARIRTHERRIHYKISPLQLLQLHS